MAAAAAAPSCNACKAMATVRWRGGGREGEAAWDGSSAAVAVAKAVAEVAAPAAAADAPTGDAKE